MLIDAAGAPPDTLQPVTDAQNAAAPADVDVDALAAQLAHAPVAFGTENPANAVLGRDLVSAIEAVNDADLGSVGVVVLEQTPPHVPDVRDIAQDVANASGLDTVVVRTPQVAVGVSDTLTRAEVEQGQRAMVAEPDYVQGFNEFVHAADAFTVPWGAVVALAVGVLAAAAGFTAFSARPSAQ